MTRIERINRFRENADWLRKQLRYSLNQANDKKELKQLEDTADDMEKLEKIEQLIKSNRTNPLVDCGMLLNEIEEVLGTKNKNALLEKIDELDLD